jgi:hypothetical protein
MQFQIAGMIFRPAGANGWGDMMVATGIVSRTGRFAGNNLWQKTSLQGFPNPQ